METTDEQSPASLNAPSPARRQSMWPEQPGVVYGISWQDVFPWALLGKLFSLAASVPVLLLAALGVLLAPAGWWAGERLFLDATLIATDDDFARWAEARSKWRLSDAGVWGAVLQPESEGPIISRVAAAYAAAAMDLVDVFTDHVRPIFFLFRTDLTLTRAAYLTMGGLWTLLVWALVGGAIARLAVVKFSREESIGVVASARHVARRLDRYFTTPLYPVVGLLIAALPIIVLGWLARSEIGAVVSGMLWPIALGLGYVMAMFALGLLFGWPLLWPALAAEDSDAFDAISRAYSYVFQRPFKYAFCAAAALALGAGGWLLVSLFVETLLYLTQWAASLGLGASGVFENHALVRDRAEGPTVGAGGSLLFFWSAAVQLVAGAFRHSFFWCAAAAIYLLLRLDVDQQEMDKVAHRDTAAAPALAAVQGDARS